MHINSFEVMKKSKLILNLYSNAAHRIRKRVEAAVMNEIKTLHLHLRENLQDLSILINNHLAHNQQKRFTSKTIF